MTLCLARSSLVQHQPLVHRSKKRRSLCPSLSVAPPRRQTRLQPRRRPTKIAAIARGVGARARRRHARARRRRAGSGVAAPQPLADAADQSLADISELVEDVHYMLLSSGMTESEMVNLVDLSSRNHHVKDEHGENLYYGSVL